MAWTLLFVLTTLHTGSCDLWVSQAAEVHAQEGAAALLPCSFNASSSGLAIGSVTWYRDKVAPENEVKNETPEFRGRLAPLAPSRFLREHQAELRLGDTRARDAGVYLSPARGNPAALLHRLFAVIQTHDRFPLQETPLVP
ncbi:natural cytotoxicity triggering receptor 3 [Fukomys damarensis]|uniref:natural cytotoxicity triggering receptor 3 n=1 Tax=Fukomys damarensis TaxID=885580 RepID=UPI00053F7960|nr:natural cytotoxicity triggering receptor 3 [Fukomys damarensis]